MALEFSEVYATTPLLYGCGPKGITCYGGGTMLACFEAIGHVPDGHGGWTPETYDYATMIRSTDNGVTWTADDAIRTASLWFYQAYCPVNGRVVIGTSGPDAVPSTGMLDTGAVVSNDGGATWTIAFPGWPFQEWETYGIGILSATHLFAIGLYKVDDGAGGYTPYDVAISYDGGVTFSEFRLIDWDVWWTCITVCDDGTILLGTDRVYGNGVIYRSTDGGENFTAITVPCTQHFSEDDYVTINDIADLGGGVCLAVGVGFWDSGAQRLWRSTDSGATWAEITDSLAGDASNAPSHLVVWGDGLHACRIGAAGAVCFTEDGGDSWTLADVPAHGANARMFYGNVADDGSICVTVYDTSYENAYKIWRAVPTWTIAGPCYAPAPPPVPHDHPAPPAAGLFPLTTACDQECDL